MTRRTMGCLAMTVAVWLCSATALASTPADDKAIVDAVLAVNAQMTEAAEQGDIDRLFSFIEETTEGSIVQNGEVWVTRQQALDRTRTNMSGVGRVKYRWNRQLVSVLSPEVAVLTADGESTVTLADGRSFTAPFAQTVVFVRKDGRWKAIHAHQSSPRTR